MVRPDAGIVAPSRAGPQRVPYAPRGGSISLSLLFLRLPDPMPAAAIDANNVVQLTVQLDVAMYSFSLKRRSLPLHRERPASAPVQQVLHHGVDTPALVSEALK